nr:MAG TPA: hypothetical protein [Caudoviricetes sp.]
MLLILYHRISPAYIFTIPFRFRWRRLVERLFLSF